MNSFISYRKQLELIRTSLKSETSNEPGVNLLQYCGSEEYYTQIDNCIDILIDFYEKYLNTSSTREKINEVLKDELIVHLPQIKSALTPVFQGLTNVVKFLITHFNGLVAIGSVVVGTFVAFNVINGVIS